jgi:hypothetical protein
MRHKLTAQTLQRRPNRRTHGQSILFFCSYFDVFFPELSPAAHLRSENARRIKGLFFVQRLSRFQWIGFFKSLEKLFGRPAKRRLAQWITGKQFHREIIQRNRFIDGQVYYDVHKIR